MDGNGCILGDVDGLSVTTGSSSYSRLFDVSRRSLFLCAIMLCAAASPDALQTHGGFIGLPPIRPDIEEISPLSQFEEMNRFTLLH
jgi:hypothetical protein